MVEIYFTNLKESLRASESNKYYDKEKFQYTINCQNLNPNLIHFSNMWFIDIEIQFTFLKNQIHKIYWRLTCLNPLLQFLNSTDVCWNMQSKLTSLN